MTDVSLVGGPAFTPSETCARAGRQPRAATATVRKDVVILFIALLLLDRRRRGESVCPRTHSKHPPQTHFAPGCRRISTERTALVSLSPRGRSHEPFDDGWSAGAMSEREDLVHWAQAHPASH